MPAKKTASKKRKPASVSRKKAAKSRSDAKKKSTEKMRKVSKKKISAKKMPKKKTVARKKPASKKVVSKKKPVAKKASTKKPAAKKKISKKKLAAKKTVSRKKISKKKPAAKKTVSRKKISKKALPRQIPAARRAPVPRTTPLRKPRTGADLLSGPIHGIAPYSPQRGEEYMSAEQLDHFDTILQSWKDELMIEVDRTVNHMQDEAANFPDPNDRATQESEFGLELRTRDRERKLLRKINSALIRVEKGSYGFCEETGEEIGLKRLEARPVATLCVEAQERREMADRQFRDHDDRYR
jgi:DnaK suppressor protein